MLRVAAVLFGLNFKGNSAETIEEMEKSVSQREAVNKS